MRKMWVHQDDNTAVVSVVAVAVAVACVAMMILMRNHSVSE